MSEKKGLSLEELKAALEGEAQKKAQEQEKKIIDLNLQVLNQRHSMRLLGEALDQKDQELFWLFERCRALTNGALCRYCTLVSRCDMLRMRYYGKGLHIPELKKHAEEALLKLCTQKVEKYEAAHPEVKKEETK